MNRSVRRSSRRCGTCASGTGASWAWAVPTHTANPQRSHETINARKFHLDSVIGTVRPNGRRSAAADRIRSRRGHERSECLGAFQSQPPAATHVRPRSRHTTIQSTLTSCIANVPRAVRRVRRSVSLVI